MLELVQSSIDSFANNDNTCVYYIYVLLMLRPSEVHLRHLRQILRISRKTTFQFAIYNDFSGSYDSDCLC